MMKVSIIIIIIIIIINIYYDYYYYNYYYEKFKQLGFSDHDGANHLFNPVHWFHFAGDAAAISSSERENQLLLNCFTRWCNGHKRL